MRLILSFLLVFVACSVVSAHYGRSYWWRRRRYGWGYLQWRKLPFRRWKFDSRCLCYTKACAEKYGCRMASSPLSSCIQSKTISNTWTCRSGTACTFLPGSGSEKEVQEKARLEYLDFQQKIASEVTKQLSKNEVEIGFINKSPELIKSENQEMEQELYTEEAEADERQEITAILESPSALCLPVASSGGSCNFDLNLPNVAVCPSGHLCVDGKCVSLEKLGLQVWGTQCEYYGLPTNFCGSGMCGTPQPVVWQGDAKVDEVPTALAEEYRNLMKKSPLSYPERTLLQTEVETVKFREQLSEPVQKSFDDLEMRKEESNVCLANTRVCVSKPTRIGGFCTNFILCPEGSRCVADTFPAIGTCQVDLEYKKEAEEMAKKKASVFAKSLV